MSKNTDSLVKAITTTKKKPVVERATSWLDKNVLPYIAIGIMVAGTVDSSVSRVKQVPNLPEFVQGAIVVVALAFIFSRAFRFFSSKRK